MVFLQKKSDHATALLKHLWVVLCRVSRLFLSPTHPRHRTLFIQEVCGKDSGSTVLCMCLCVGTGWNLCLQVRAKAYTIWKNNPSTILLPLSSLCPTNPAWEQLSDTPGTSRPSYNSFSTWLNSMPEWPHTAVQVVHCTPVQLLWLCPCHPPKYLPHKYSELLGIPWKCHTFLLLIHQENSNEVPSFGHSRNIYLLSARQGYFLWYFIPRGSQHSAKYTMGTQ